ncbi:unnamed protein product [Camellia sinensis]
MAHTRELEEEVNLFENLSHPNIVRRYLGMTREEASLNILLEIVPGGSITSLMGKFGSFPEFCYKNVHKIVVVGSGIPSHEWNNAQANILVDNKGCIKLADFGESKKVVELATVIGAKSMKGTPYWMAFEVILQIGHSFSVDIWSVGCTVIEMATGKPPWSQQYQEVAALFHIGTTKSHPPILDHLSAEAIDFLLKCLQKEPNLRPAASDLLQHPFVTMEYQETYPVIRASVMETFGKKMTTPEMELKNSKTYMRLKDVHNSVRCSTIYPEKFPGSVPHWGSGNCDDDMCQIDDEDDLVIGASAKFDFALLSDDFNKSFNPMSEPDDNWLCKSDDTSKKFPGSAPHWGSGNCDDDMCQIDDEDDLVIEASAKLTRPLVAEDDDDDDERFEVDYLGSGNCDDDMCQIDDEDDLLIGASTKFDSALLSDDFNKLTSLLTSLEHWVRGTMILHFHMGP